MAPAWAATAAAAAGPASAPHILSSRGLGAVRLGMSQAQLRAALAQPLGVLEAGPETCLTLETSRAVEPILTFTLREDRLRLIKVAGRGVATRSGVVVGMAFDQVKALFGPELEVGTNSYNDNVIEATVWETDRHHGVRFAVRNGHVEAMVAGDDALQWVEGCDG